MSTTKMRGFDNPGQMREYLEELEDVPSNDPPRDRAMQREIAVLRARIEELRLHLEELPAAKADPAPQPASWSQAAGTLALTFVIGHFARRFGLGRLGALASPFVASYVGKRMGMTA